MTVIQKQCLLKYLGYYSGNIDGDWGARSKEATKQFQSANGLTDDGVFGAKTEEVIKTAVFYDKFAGKDTDVPTTDSDNWWDDIKYFDRSEYACKCGGKYCNGYPAEPQKALVQAADKVREHFGRPINVSSGVRCSKHNANVGGVSGSRHLTGKAMDFCVSGKSATSVLEYVNTLPEIRYAYAIDGSYVHMDIN